jgi:riboflavin biosynthesis pyrimidine reductase
MSRSSPPEFTTLFRAPGLPPSDLPPALRRIYGDYDVTAPVVYANMVASIDGIVAIPGVARSSALISGGDPADRFVVALLRATADAVVIGAGTFREHEGPWSAEKAYPESAGAFLDLRRRDGASPQPRLVVVTASGDVASSRSKLDGALVFTTTEGARRLRREAPDAAEVVALSAARSIDVGEVFRTLSGRGYARILTEGGPAILGRSLEAGAVGELFLTVSPIVAGGGEAQLRSTLAPGVGFLPEAPLPAQLLSVHRSGAYLFLRYAFATRSRA